MTTNIQADPCENKAYSVRMADVLNDALRKVKADWVAKALNIPASVISEMRRGTRRIPASFVPDLDNLLGRHDLLEELAAMEGCGIYTKDPSTLSARELEEVFILSLREEGAAHAEIAQALLDGVIDPVERQAIHAKAVKMRRLWSEIEERTSAGALNARVAS